MNKNEAWWRGTRGNTEMNNIMSFPGRIFVLYDTETTGLSKETDRIIQFSGIKCKVEENLEFTPVSKFDMYINPERLLDAKITEITGITDEMLTGAKKENEAWPKIYKFLTGSDHTLPVDQETIYVCGHNVPFDIGMLQAMANRQIGRYLNLASMDTLTMARELHSRNETGDHKLGTLARHFGCADGLTFHNSMDDITATMRLLRVFIDEYKEKAAIAQKPKVKTNVVSCWPYNPGYTENVCGRKMPMKRLYVKLAYENRLVFLNQGYRPYEWREKDPGTLDIIDMGDVENQVMRMYNVSSVDDLANVTERRYGGYMKTSSSNAQKPSQAVQASLF